MITQNSGVFTLKYSQTKNHDIETINKQSWLISTTTTTMITEIDNVYLPAYAPYARRYRFTIFMLGMVWFQGTNTPP